MAFDEAALTRLRRYRAEADASLKNIRGADEMAKAFSERLFGGLEYTASLAEEAGFEVGLSRGDGSLSVRVVAGGREAAEATFAHIPGAAAETDEDLMHEELSRYSLDPSGYAGRVLGWTDAGEPCQIFSVYRDGIWKTKGIFVAKARGKVHDPEEISNGFCLRIIGRIVDIAAMTGGAGRKWAKAEYTRHDFAEGLPFPTEIRFPK